MRAWRKYSFDAHFPGNFVQGVVLDLIHPTPPTGEGDFVKWWSLVIRSTPPHMCKGTSPLIMLTAWWILKHRNATVFDNSRPSVPSLFEMIIAEAHSWAMAGARGLGQLLLKSSEGKHIFHDCSQHMRRHYIILLPTSIFLIQPPNQLRQRYFSAQHDNRCAEKDLITSKNTSTNNTVACRSQVCQC
jgi:hypothetical protein